MNTVRLATFQTLQEAYIVKGMLDDNGIPSMVTNENNLYVPVFQGVTLWVADNQLDEARRLLEIHHDD